MWDLNSLPRDRTPVPCIGRWILHHWTTREVPGCVLMFAIMWGGTTKCKSAQGLVLGNCGGMHVLGRRKLGCGFCLGRSGKDWKGRGCWGWIVVFYHLPFWYLCDSLSPGQKKEIEDELLLFSFFQWDKFAFPSCFWTCAWLFFLNFFPGFLFCFVLFSLAFAVLFFLLGFFLRI